MAGEASHVIVLPASSKKANTSAESGYARRSQSAGGKLHAAARSREGLQVSLAALYDKNQPDRAYA